MSAAYPAGASRGGVEYIEVSVIGRWHIVVKNDIQLYHIACDGYIWSGEEDRVLLLADGFLGQVVRSDTLHDAICRARTGGRIVQNDFMS